ncbi:hypothetical protein [Corynebacterium sp.]|uniref:hypothetical protein n=1 Tax=Corynebacterium sp. TaxID=1720 RepID=UPI0026DC56A7|nr:hypothetical protein [Corynebacterium sp.]MDO5076342.1 hypothetical protein [Corynebacterium sp.]
MKIFSPVVGLYTALLLSASVVTAPLAAAEPMNTVAENEPAVVAPADAGTATELDTVDDLKKASGLSGTVKTKGHAKADDGAGMEFSIEGEKPDGVLGNIAVPLADGKWAVPANLPTSPSTPVNNAAVDDAIARAETFVNAGHDLKWNDRGMTPLHTSEVVHEKSQKPYAIYCSALIGMILKGWDYEHTTYVADKNSVVGAAAELSNEADKTDVENDMWQSNKLARWFYTDGDLWLNDGNQNYERGDLLFLSEQKPEGKDSNTGSYFGNIYHVAMYIGDNKVIHSYSPDSDGGVVVQDLNEYLSNNTSFIARPSWDKGGAGKKSDSSTNKDAGKDSNKDTNKDTNKCGARGDQGAAGDPNAAEGATDDAAHQGGGCNQQGNNDDSGRAEHPIGVERQGQLSH